MAKNPMDEFVSRIFNSIESATGISFDEKQKAFLGLKKLREQKANILITGATGCGKSSTINALFETEQAKVGQGADPETMDIARYELGNLTLWDSPGLGDGKEADERHSQNIANKLIEKGSDGNALIDLVLVVLDGGSRDLGTSYKLIEKVIIPTLDKNSKRLLVAINQCDMGMKGRNWDYENNVPEAPLVEFLQQKVLSVQKRIFETTGEIVDVIYYSAGFKDGDQEQRSYNMAKLFAFILEHLPENKRVVTVEQANVNINNNNNNDGLDDYIERQKEAVWSAILGAVGNKVASALGTIADGISSAISWIKSWF